MTPCGRDSSSEYSVTCAVGSTRTVTDRVAPGRPTAGSTRIAVPPAGGASGTSVAPAAATVTPPKSPVPVNRASPAAAGAGVAR